ncbi:hypothetical protein SNE40_009083 [Patella caerulea]|uniref:Outer dynein arm-docking complex subunit 4 n=1 Tax=Patella caerulea TaxID=87958 RepID=A0AAN8JTA3_PATCE
MNFDSRRPSVRPDSSKVQRANTLIRLNKKAAIPDLQSGWFDDDSSVSGKAAVDLSNGTMKRVLGRLYTDKEYLEQLKDNINRENTTFKDPKIAALADSGLKFLQERGEYWDNLGPLPPLLLKKRPKPRKKEGFMGSSYSLHSDTSQTTATTNSTKKSKTSQKSNRDQIMDPNENLQFEFRSYRPNTRYNQRNLEKMNEKRRVEMEEKAKLSRERREDKLTKAADECKEQTTLYFKKALKDIDKEFSAEYFESCEQLVLDCFKDLKNFKDDDVDNKQYFHSRLYNCLGNMNFKLEKYDQAMVCYQNALQESGSNEEFVTLGNIGRIYTYQEQHNMAMETYTQQARIATSKDETSQAFLNLGSGFLALNQFEYAKDCGRKSLNAARCADNRQREIESTILVAVCMAHLNKHKEANRKISQAQHLTNKLGNRGLTKMVEAAESEVQHVIKRNRGSAGRTRERRNTHRSFLPPISLQARSTLISTPA